MINDFEKWWDKTGYKMTHIPVELARVAFNAGLYTSPLSHSCPEFDFRSHFVKCSCGCNILEVQRFNYKDGEDGFNIVVWARGRDGKRLRGWKEKFRWCWRIIKTGCPWADDIIASNKDAHELAKFILRNLPYEEKNNGPSN